MSTNYLSSIYFRNDLIPFHGAIKRRCTEQLHDDEDNYSQQNVAKGLPVYLYVRYFIHSFIFIYLVANMQPCNLTSIIFMTSRTLINIFHTLIITFRYQKVILNNHCSHIIDVLIIRLFY